jgi:hypothetical protein
VAVKVQNPVLGRKGIPDQANCPFCKARDKGKPYDQFFTKQERDAFAQIEIDFPSFKDMLPPENGLFHSVASTKSRRKGWHDKKNKDPAVPGEFHHPHQLQAGGCPWHQDVVPVDPNNSIQASVDEQITKIVQDAVTRNA